MIEAWGQGFQKILYYCNHYKANTPVIDLSLGGVTARCFASEFYQRLEKGEEPPKATGKKTESTIKSTETETTNISDNTTQVIIDLIKNNPKITYEELTQKTGKSKITVRRYVQKLITDGTIRREGGRKLGQWIIS